MISRLKGILSSIRLIKNTKRKSKQFLCDFYYGEFKSADISFLSEREKEKIKLDADRILKGEYQIYNFPPYKKIIWNQDPVSGVIVKNAVCSALIRTSTLQNRADIKNIWEQSHIHPIVTLAQCYLLTKKEEYAKSAVKLISEFIKKNPCGKTVTWKCQMDSAIRLANIVQAMSQISDSAYFKEIEFEVQKTIIEHVIYISSDYENKGPFPNNHYLSDLVGVIWGTAYLYKNYKNIKALSCFDDAIQKLEDEINRQICQDGFDYEFSTYYHCFVTELLSETKGMLENNCMNVPDGLDQITGKMLSICNNLGAFDGNFPLIGDQDGSRLFHFKGCFDIDKCDFSSLRRFSYQNIKERNEFGGIHIFNENDLKVFFKCGCIGTSGKGTHDHNDQLSICVFVDGKEIISDSGTFCYTTDLEKRMTFRSVKAHSTVHFHEKEQNDISDVFAVKSNYCGKVLRTDKKSIAGEFLYHDGTKHIRTVSIEDGRLIIKDEAQDGISRLVLPVSREMIERVNDYEISFIIDSIKIMITSTEKINFQEASISKAYGTEVKATYIDSEVFKEHVYTISKEN